MGADLSNIAVAAISLLGTLAGSGGSIYAANWLISYRLGRLEEVVRERSGAIERIYSLEKANAVMCEQIRDVASRLETVEKRR